MRHLLAAKNDVTMILKVATIYNSIGGNEYSIGRFERAKNFFDKSIALKVKMHGTDQHVEVASSYLNMAGCLAQLNKYIQYKSQRHAFQLLPTVVLTIFYHLLQDL